MSSRTTAIHFSLLLLTGVYASGRETPAEWQLHSSQHQVPVLTQKENNPTLFMELAPAGGEEYEVSEVRVSLEGSSDLSDIDRIRLFYSKTDKLFNTEQQFGVDQRAAPEVVFSGALTHDGPVYFWVSIQLADNSDLANKIQVSAKEIRTGSGSVVTEENPSGKTLRIGTALRKHMDDGVDTYRIPAMTSTNEGTLLAVYDVRRDKSRDLQGDIDIGLSRSTDGGNSWEPMSIVLDMGEWGGLPRKFNGVSDPNILMDGWTNTIFVFGLWMHGVLDPEGNWIEGLTEESDAWEHQWRRKGSQPGTGVKETSQLIVTKSTDDGKTWSDPVNLTETKRDEWWLWAPGPGSGITLEDGTLVIPTQGRDKNGRSFSNITWSKDGGESWVTSNPAYSNTTEGKAVQLSDGSIMMNMRHNANRSDTSDSNGRAVSVTTDLGETWVNHPTSRGALIEPTCMASLIRHEFVENGERKVTTQVHTASNITVFLIFCKP